MLMRTKKKPLDKPVYHRTLSETDLENVVGGQTKKKAAKRKTKKSILRRGLVPIL